MSLGGDPHGCGDAVGADDRPELSSEVVEANLAKDLAEQMAKKYQEGLGYMYLPWFNTTIGVLVRAVRLFTEAHGGVTVVIDWNAAEIRFQ